MNMSLSSVLLAIVLLVIPPAATGTAIDSAVAVDDNAIGGTTLVVTCPALLKILKLCK